MKLFDLLFRASLEFRRQLKLPKLVLVVLAGASFGVLSSRLPVELTSAWAVIALGGLLASLLAGGAAALQRVAASGLASPTVVTTRVVGGAVAGCLLITMFVGSADILRGARNVDDALVGLSDGAGGRWRFELPAGTSGPLELELDAYLPLTQRGSVEWTATRGAAVARGSAHVPVSGSVRFRLPDLSPARGNMSLRLVAADGLVLGSAAPQLILGSRAEPVAPLRFSTTQLLRLGCVLLATLAAACAFRASTASLAGWLVLLMPAQTSPRGAAALLLLMLSLATLGFALRRRTQLA